MTTVAFFNNKGGVGKTSLVYHLAWMLGERGRRVIAADLDPQANLTGMFLDEARLEELWRDGNAGTINDGVAPLFEGTGDIVEHPQVEGIGEKIGLLMGDLGLSRREDELSTQWPKCLDGDKRAFRVTTAFARLIARAGRQFGADLALLDVGPNLGAINRAALVASDRVVIPLAPDLFSLQGLRNVGPTLREWRSAWRERAARKPGELDIRLPSGNMHPLGYVIMRHSIRLSRPVQAYGRWIDKIPSEYAEAVTQDGLPSAPAEQDPNCLAHLKDYRSLMQMAQEANLPMFLLKPAHGAIGAHQQAVLECYADFHDLAQELLVRLDGGC
jgi:cellulose biosynthesis protein BcsQ